MLDIWIGEVTHYLRYGIYLADVREEFISQSLPLGCSRYETRYIYKFYSGRYDLLRGVQGSQSVLPRVGHSHHADIGINSAEGIIGRFGAVGARERIEECAFADIGQSDDTDLEHNEV